MLPANSGQSEGEALQDSGGAGSLPSRAVVQYVPSSFPAWLVFLERAQVLPSVTRRLRMLIALEQATCFLDVYEAEDTALWGG